MKFDLKNAICGFSLSLGVVLFASVIFCVVHGHLVAAAVLAFCICILAAVIAGMNSEEKDAHDEWWEDLIKETVREVLKDENA